MSRLAVTGGRDFADHRYLFEVLGIAHAAEPITLLIHGSCWGTQTAPGADLIAEDWAKDRGVPYIGIPAWPRIRDATAQYSKSAGPRRNGLIMKMKPTRLIAMPGGKGTADMIGRARTHNKNLATGRVTRDIPPGHCWISEYIYDSDSTVGRIMLRPTD